jgi:hypothetical protein
MPLSQLRGMVARDVFWQNPKKRRWAKRRLWWREHYGWVIVTVLGLLIAGAWSAHRWRFNGRNLSQLVFDTCTAMNWHHPNCQSTANFAKLARTKLRTT